jgi:hypothetical protein
MHFLINKLYKDYIIKTIEQTKQQALETLVSCMESHLNKLHPNINKLLEFCYNNNLDCSQYSNIITGRFLKIINDFNMELIDTPFEQLNKIAKVQSKNINAIIEFLELQTNNR